MKNNVKKSVISVACCLLLLLTAFLCVNTGAADPEPQVVISSASLSLDDNVYIYFSAYYDGINTAADKYGMILSSSEITDAYTYANAVADGATVLGATDNWRYDDTVKKDVAVYKHGVAAKEMSDMVWARAYAEKDGVYYYSDVRPYSVTTYAARKLGLVDGVEGTTDNNLISLLRGMLEYGALAQNYFNYKTDNLATDILASRYTVTVTGGNIKNVGTSGSYLSGTNITLVAEVPADKVFVCWQDDAGAVIGATTSIGVTVTENSEYTAVLTDKSYNYDLFTFEDVTIDGVEGYDVYLKRKAELGGLTMPETLLIPPTYNDKPVLSICYGNYGPDLSEHNTITSIVIPDSVTCIGLNAFYRCHTVKSIVIPDGITNIMYHAFTDCTSLTSITIPGGVVAIEESAFFNCNAMRSITVAEENTVYHSSGNCLIETGTKTLMFGCSNSVIPADGSVTSIAESAFRDRTALTSITIPDSITNIMFNAFSNCTSLRSITISGGVISIGSAAFYGCTALRSITLPDSVTSIGSDAFNGCTALKSITVPDSVTSIGSGVFHGCTALESITVPDSVTSIGSGAFYGCTALESITVPDSVTDVGYHAFYNSGYYNNIYNWNDNTLYIGNILIAVNTSYNGALTIRPGTKTIAEYAFDNCISITGVTIPDSVTNIGARAFNACGGLTDVTLPVNLKVINDRMFYSCGELKTVTIPAGVTNIHEYVFHLCPKLEKIKYQGTETQWNNIDKASSWKGTNPAEVTFSAP